MKPRARSATALLTLLVARGPASAQSTAPLSSGAVRESAGAVLIEIPVNVVGKDGKPVAGLTAWGRTAGRGQWSWRSPGSLTPNEEEAASSCCHSSRRASPSDATR